MIDRLITLIPFIVGVLAIIALVYFKTFPSIESICRVADLLNSKGGIILLLSSMSVFFFMVGVHFIYWSAEKIMDGKLSADNAMVMMGVTFMTGSAFGGAFGSLLKSMTGESPAQPSVTSTTSVTKSGEPLPPIPTNPKPPLGGI